MFIIRSHRCSVTIAPHAICMRANILSLRLIENFLRFQVQDKHNAFSPIICIEKNNPYPTVKLVKSCNNKHSTSELLRLRSMF